MRRRKAEGILLIHTDKSAGYGFNVLQSTKTTENVRFADSMPGEKPLKVRSWITSDVAEKLLRKPYSALWESAVESSFCATPVQTEITINLKVGTVRMLWPFVALENFFYLNVLIL